MLTNVSRETKEQPADLMASCQAAIKALADCYSSNGSFVLAVISEDNVEVVGAASPEELLDASEAIAREAAVSAGVPRELVSVLAGSNGRVEDVPGDADTINEALGLSSGEAA